MFAVSFSSKTKGKHFFISDVKLRTMSPKMDRKSE